jgi:hypothetical protein
MDTMETKAPPPVLLTVAKIKAAIQRMDEAIAAAEPHAPQFSGEDWRSFMALKQRRHGLHMLLLARKVEQGKKVVSLHRWRYGFETTEAPPTVEQLNSDITKAIR